MFGDKTSYWHYSGRLSSDCSLTVIVIIFGKSQSCMRHHGWRKKEKLQFSFFWSLKSAFLMFFESKYKRNWTLYDEHEGWNRGDSTPRPFVHSGPFFQKRTSHSNTKYSITSINKDVNIRGISKDVKAL